MPGRVVLLDCSPRVAPGCLTVEAWDALRSATRVLTGTSDHPQLDALAYAGLTVEVLPVDDPRRLGDDLIAAARDGSVVWLLAPDGDAALTSALAARLVLAGSVGPVGRADTVGSVGRTDTVGSVGRTDTADPVEVEHLLGSYDLPGSHVLDLVAVMDRLRSPGGCPWDAEQTHASLSRYLIEEAYEVAEAIDTGDAKHLVEELGDVLLQVVFHARVAADSDDHAFTVDDVADGIVAKLVRRHPHVFAGADAVTPAQVESNWEQIKAAEKGRTSVLDGIPPALPALSYAEKVLVRAERTGLDLPSGPQGGKADGGVPVGAASIRSAAEVGTELLALVRVARRLGVDPEAALRRAARDLVDAASQAGAVSPGAA